MWTFLWTGYATSPWTGQGILDGKISFFRQHLALGRTGRYSRSISASLACCSRADAFEHVLLRLLLRLVALAVYQLALERLEEGFRERVVPWVARPRHGSGDPMGLEAALERPGSVLGTLVIAEDEVEVVGRLSLLTACSSASATDFSVMRPDIDLPTTFLRNASITAARQGHPWPVPMQAMPPAHSLLRASTPNAPSTRFTRRTPISPQ